MQQNLENKIGFTHIRESIKSRCSTDYGRERAAGETISANAAAIEKRLSLTDELKQIIMFEHKFPQGEFIDCTGFLPALEAQYSCISIENMRKLQQLMQNLRQIIAFLGNVREGQYLHLKQLAKPVQYFPEIDRRIDIILDKNGDIKESASAELARICRELLHTQNSIGRRVEAILNKAKTEGITEADAAVSVRDGKLLIPVISYNKRSLAGVVQDASASGKTLFIEPLEVVEMNNRVRELEFERQREIQRILAEFSDFVRPYIPELKEGARFIGEVDFIRAKAECARQMGAGKPIISRDGVLRIVKGRHPVLEAALAREGRQVVPTDLELSRKRHILIISGPNAGGKSVCLKTTGILQYMFQWGMLTTCSEVSEFPVLKNIFIDIGDEQSMENDLSTYSSHLLNMRELLKVADDSTLALIDEFGSGTEPAAGGAIAETILEELERLGVYGVITTHYTNLKVYAEHSNGVLNGAMLFDSVNIQPLYKLETGVPGNSFAFDLARKTGLPEQLVKRAEEKAGEDFIDLEKQLRKISRNRRQIEQRLTKIKFTDKNLEEITERYAQELADIKKNKKQIIEQAKEEARQILLQANKKIEATIKTIKETQAEKERTRQARERLKDFSDSIENKSGSQNDKKIEQKMEQLAQRKKRQEERRLRRAQKEAAQGTHNGEGMGLAQDANGQKPEEKPELARGVKVRVKGSDLIGQVIAVDKKWVSISVGDIISKLKADAVEPISSKEFEKMRKPQRRSTLVVDADIDKRKLEFKTEIDIRGARLGEALDAVSRFIDDAMLVGVGQVRILHGKGTGVLKEEIRKYLKTIPAVASVKEEDVRFGGSGITIVNLE